MNSGTPATFLESLVYRNLFLLRRTRDRQPTKKSKNGHPPAGRVQNPV